MIRFGILGAGKIAKRFAASLEHEEDAELVAVSCRSSEKAAAWVGVGSVAAEKAYAGEDAHRALIDDPDVDAIYLALPTQLHFQWAKEALEADKPVLCEKPAMVNAEQMREILNISRERDVLFMEAMKPRFVSLYPAALDAIKKLGEIDHIEVSLCNDMLSDLMAEPSYHLMGGEGSGALLDCGTYCASWIEELCPGEIKVLRVSNSFIGDADISDTAWLESDGVTAILECSFTSSKPRTATIVGRDGGVVVVDDLHRPQSLTITSPDGVKTTMRSPYVHDDLFGEIYHFCQLLRLDRTESRLMSLGDSLRIAELLDAIREY